MNEDELLRQSTLLMSLVVRHPGRLHRSAHGEARQRAAEENAAKMRSASGHAMPFGTPSALSVAGSPATPRKGLSRTNSLRRSMKEIKLRPTAGAAQGNSRPTSFVV